MNNLPHARSTDIVLQTLGGEILIYDLTTHKAYNLNETSAAVYSSCDGKTSFEELRAKTGFSDDFIFLALDELRKENLLENSIEYDSPFKGMSRREAIRKVGLASMIALPVISSLVAPTALMAQSAGGVAPGSRTLGESCTTSTDCASGAPNCNSGTCCVGPGSQPYGYSINYITNGVCPASGNCTSLHGASCCSGTASESSCTELVPGTIQLTCVCD